MGSGCKKLHGMTSSSKIYVAEARLGFSSTTLDCTGSLLTQGPTDHVTKERLLETLIAFRGEIRQTPPLYSALSMDGKRLYDYAREGVPLPREIPERTVQIHELDLLSFPGPDGVTECSPDLVRLGFRSHHPRSNDAQDETAVNTLPFESRSGFKPKPLLHDPNATNDATFVPLPDPSQPGSRGLYFHLRVHCSSGTYIRTLIADIATRLGTVGHMTDLLRTEQKGFMLDGGMTIEMSDCEDLDRVDQAILASQLEESKSGP
ncbi:hypothetical protein BGW38_002899 [Lunasporangiospora selenospora]|uniref:tRNA pseudouridine(55) synthase n=1 Tax=Lunasporangiospora selenospora TaxID=979761 RepID=A0A9P6FS47_9FUNG|nr:hypothetical protein BGW38_002899 [Lunasporangiospora selenospora]